MPTCSWGQTDLSQKNAVGKGKFESECFFLLYSHQSLKLKVRHKQGKNKKKLEQRLSFSARKEQEC